MRATPTFKSGHGNAMSLAIFIVASFLCTPCFGQPGNSGNSNRPDTPPGQSNRPPHAGGPSENGIRNRRKGLLKRFEVSNLDENGRQNCGTQVMIQMFEDLPVQRFKDPDCPNVFARSRRQGSFVGKDGAITLSMRRSGGGRVAASVNDIENKILYQITGSEMDGLEVLETPLENMMEEADAPEPTGSVRTRNLRRSESDNEKESYSLPVPSSTIRKSPRPTMRHQFNHDRPSSRSLEYDDSGGNIDIMVVWTKMAECRNSGLDINCELTAATEANMMTRVELAVDETNEAFLQSGVRTELRLVHAYRHPTYVEVQDDRSETALRDITSGGMEGVHETRTEYGADIVSLLINANDFCGIAWNLFDHGVHENYMYSVSHYRCATGYYSFGHEIGHNFGCNHDRGVEDKCDESRYDSYNFGYRDPDARFRSIMGYNCRQSQCDTNADDCMRVQRFSNTYQEYDNRPIGNAHNNCAQQFNDNLSEVAGFFPAVADATPSPSDTPTLSPSQQPTAGPSAVPSLMPSSEPSSSPTRSPSVHPSIEPSFAPSLSPSRLPSEEPTDPSPSTSPSDSPIGAPSNGPTVSPVYPSATPSDSPVHPSSVPSLPPSKEPTEFPSVPPSIAPSSKPTASPSAVPSSSPIHPSSTPSAMPSWEPTKSPSSSPSLAPSVTPTKSPTETPSTSPTETPSMFPTKFPTTPPSVSPTAKPTMFPSAPPSSADCTGGVGNVCGYVQNDDGVVVPGAYSVCVYRTDKGDFRTECLGTAELVGRNVGTILKNGDDRIESCGCCEGDSDEYCTNEPICVADDGVCGETKDGYAEMRYCYYDRKKGNREKCDDPFKDPKIPFVGCGACP